MRSRLAAAAGLAFAGGRTPGLDEGSYDWQKIIQTNSRIKLNVISATGHGDDIRVIDGHACFFLVGGHLMINPGFCIVLFKLEVSTHGICSASPEPTKT